MTFSELMTDRSVRGTAFKVAVAIVAGLLLLLALRPGTGVLLASGGVALLALVLMIVRPEAPLLMLAALAPLGELQEGSSQFGSLTAMLAGLVFLLWCLRVIRGQAGLPREPLFLVVFLVVLIRLLWLVIGDVDSGGRPLAMVARQFGYLALMLATVSLIPNREQVQRVLVVFVLATAFVALASVVPGIASLVGLDIDTVSSVEQGRLRSAEAKPNGFATVFVFAIPATVALAMSARRKLTMAIWLAPLVPLLVALIFTFSRSAMIGVVLGLAVGTLLSRRGVRARALLLLGVMAGILFALGLADALTSRVESSVNIETDESIRSRLETWGAYLELVADNPLGAGPEMTEQLQSVRFTTPHNSLLLFAGELGIPGVVLYVLIVLCMVERLRTGLRAAVEPGATALMAAFIAMWVGFLVHTSFHMIWYNDMVWLMAGVTLAGIHAIGGIRGRHTDEVQAPGPLRAGLLSRMDTPAAQPDHR